MFPTPNSINNSCTDSSPKFLQSPYFVTCAGSEYRYNMNAVDPDLDSLQFDFGIPYETISQLEIMIHQTILYLFRLRQTFPFHLRLLE